MDRDLEHIVKPDQLALENPDFVTNLRINQNRLTTPFDLHATLLETISYPIIPTYTPHQISLFKNISDYRTCSQAKVEKHWCPCQRSNEVEITHEVINGAKKLVEELNGRLLEHGEEKCSELSLSKVIRAEVLLFHNTLMAFEKSSDVDGRKPKLKENFKGKVNYQIQFEIIPGGGILEGDFSINSGKIEIGHFFSRLNSYGTLFCNPKPVVREFCTCRNSTILDK